MPSCGAQNLFRLVAPTNFDRCAILASLHHPPGALRRRCPARGFGAVLNVFQVMFYRVFICFLVQDTQKQSQLFSQY